MHKRWELEIKGLRTEIRVVRMLNDAAQERGDFSLAPVAELEIEDLETTIHGIYLIARW